MNEKEKNRINRGITYLLAYQKRINIPDFNKSVQKSLNISDVEVGEILKHKTGLQLFNSEMNKIISKKYESEIKKLETGRKKETIIKKIDIVKRMRKEGMSSKAISRVFGNDHTTILNLLNR